MGRLRYLLRHGAKEGLVYSPLDWPGVHCAPHLCDGSMRMRGRWRDDSRLYEARRRGENPDPEVCSVDEELELSPLPCWQHLLQSEYKKRMQEMVEEIERETLRKHRRDNTSPAGVTALLQLDPLSSPRNPKRSPAPAFHTASRAAFHRLRDAYRTFVAEFYRAAEELLSGNRSVDFPPGSFPPGLPFVDPAPS